MRKTSEGNRIKSVAIIGAGAAGAITAAAFKAEDYFERIRVFERREKPDSFLELNTTVEDISRLLPLSKNGFERWKLTLRKHDALQHVDTWWEEEFDAVILANGHYSVPWIPPVDGLEAYIQKFPGRVVHSKSYRSPHPYSSQRVVVIGNSASGHDVTAELASVAHSPVYQSRRTRSRWDGDAAPPGIEWKPTIKKYEADGRIIFEDGTYLDDVDSIIYCTGYKASFPFWNSKVNGRPLWDYEFNKLIKGYWHMFFQDFSTLAIVGLPRVLTFRSFEYQAIILARLFSGRNSLPLPPVKEQEIWEKERESETKREGKKFHDIQWETGETKEWLELMFKIAGLGTLTGEGRLPPVLGKDLIWAVEHVKKYPEPGEGKNDASTNDKDVSEVGEWVMINQPQKDLLPLI
ncbi:Fc.00g072410.m01.CDS01 [Cosmosporella sp. VM-42]